MLWTLVVGGCLAAGSVVADSAPREHLQRMVQAMHSLAYEGVFVYTQGDRAETMQIVHGLVDGESRERVSTLTGPALEVIRRGDEVVCLMPEAGRALIGQRPPGLLPGILTGGVEDLSDHYRVMIGDDSRVAGREAREIRIAPTDGYRHGLRVWLDREHGLLLRAEQFAGDGSVVERVMFTELRVMDAVDADRFRYSLDDFGDVREAVTSSPSTDTDDTTGVPWIEPGLPPGFMLVGVTTVDGGAMDGGVRQHSVYSDGLASVSVFVETEPTERALPRALRRGALRMRSARVDGKRVTLVGAVPEATLDYMLGTLGVGSGGAAE